MTKEEAKEFISLDTIRKNWILIVAIVGAIFWAANLKARVEEHQTTLIHIGNEGSELKKSTYRMEGDIKEIKAILLERKDKK